MTDSIRNNNILTEFVDISDVLWEYVHNLPLWLKSSDEKNRMNLISHQSTDEAQLMKTPHDTSLTDPPCQI